MKPEEIPQQLKDILDRRAGKTHSTKGSVMAALAEILTEHRKIVESEIKNVAKHYYAYAEKREGKYWAITSWRNEGPFETWQEADRHAVQIFKEEVKREVESDTW